MKKQIVVTSDGSHSISIPEMGVSYHSTHGAIQESAHVFINAGLLPILNASPGEISIFEMGFGTGLNALLTIAEAERHQRTIRYETVELYPLELETFSTLNYTAQLDRPDLEPLLQLMHTCEWDQNIAITPYFNFKKKRTDLTNYSTHQPINLIYFDAFAPEAQPELWTVDVFKKLSDYMQAGAVLTTYCSKSIVRKAMAAAGLTVEKIPGPPHKREMVRAQKKCVVTIE